MELKYCRRLEMLIHAKIVYLNKPLSLITEIKLKRGSALLIFTKKN